LLKLNRILGFGLLVCIITFTSFTTTSDDISTTVIVIDGKALLVDVDDRGEVITTYMEVPEYLTSTKNHSDKVTEAKASYMRLSKLQMDQIRFISILDADEVYKVTMLDNLSDLAKHYSQTYANEIVITVAKSNSNQKVIDYNLAAMKDKLHTLGVPEADITVDYKIDLGEAPTPFIKVASRLRKLASL